MARRIILVVGLVWLVGTVVAIISLVDARSQLALGAADLRRAEADVSLLPKDSDVARPLRAGTDDVLAASSHFERARTDMWLMSPVLPHLHWVPIVGADLAAAPSAIDMATFTTSGLHALFSGLTPLATGLSGSSQHHLAIPVLLAALNDSAPSFRRACVDFKKARLKRLTIGPGTGHLKAQLSQFDRRLPDLLAACQGLIGLPSMLGHGHRITYLVAYQNEDELRATGGFIGSAGLVTLRNGTLTTQFHGSAISRENLSVPPPEPVLLYNQESAWLFRDSNWSPDFPTSAQLELYFLRLDLHREADAVIDLTAGAAHDLLAATGPIYVPEYRRWVNADNVASLADYYTHYTIAHGPLQFSNEDTTRQQFIALVTRAILQRLPSFSGQTILHLAQSVATSMNNRDLLVYFRDPTSEALLRSTGSTGQINRTEGDFLYVVDTNLSYNKVNPYVRVSTSYDTTIRRDGWLQSHLDIHVKYAMPPLQVRGQGIGPGGGQYGRRYDYADFLRIYVPDGASLIDQSGWTQVWSPGPAYGKTMLCGYLIVPAGQARTIHLEYIIPPNALASSGGQYSLVQQFQPGSHPQSWALTVRQGGRRQTSMRVLSPHQDWSVHTHLGSITARSIPLSRQDGTVVAPGHWIEPHAFLSRPSP